MKIVCISNSGSINYINLTVGKVYEVLDIHKFEDKKQAFYTIRNDLGIRYWYQVDLFTPLKEIRKQKLQKLNENR